MPTVTMSNSIIPAVPRSTGSSRLFSPCGLGVTAVPSGTAEILRTTESIAQRRQFGDNLVTRRDAIKGNLGGVTTIHQQGSDPGCCVKTPRPLREIKARDVIETAPNS